MAKIKFKCLILVIENRWIMKMCIIWEYSDLTWNKYILLLFGAVSLLFTCSDGSQGKLKWKTLFTYIFFHIYTIVYKNKLLLVCALIWWKNFNFFFSFDNFTMIYIQINNEFISLNSIGFDNIYSCDEASDILFIFHFYVYMYGSECIFSWCCCSAKHF